LALWLWVGPFIASFNDMKNKWHKAMSIAR